MSKNTDKFKLMEDPEVAGGAGDWNYCPKCGTTLRDGYCRRCEQDYSGSQIMTQDDGMSGAGIPSDYDPMPSPAQKRNANRNRGKYGSTNKNKYQSSEW